MKSDIALIQDAVHLYWEDALPESYDSLDDLQEHLRLFISYLLEKQPERLLQAAYRLDLPEKKFTEAFYRQDATQIALLILEREQKRIFFRKKYSS
jgi:hypothetical protein